MDIERVKDFEKALARLKEAYWKALQNKETGDYPFFRDSSIQRFEFTVEIFWRTLKFFLQENEGIICNSPKSCIREYFSLGYLSEDKARKFLEMIDYRNLTSHTYHEEIAEQIFRKIKGYLPLLEEVLEKFLANV